MILCCFSISVACNTAAALARSTSIAADSSDLIRPSSLIFHHLPSSSLIFHHLPSSSIIFHRVSMCFPMNKSLRHLSGKSTGPNLRSRDSWHGTIEPLTPTSPTLKTVMEPLFSSCNQWLYGKLGGSRFRTSGAVAMPGRPGSCSSLGAARGPSIASYQCIPIPTYLSYHTGI